MSTYSLLSLLLAFWTGAAPAGPAPELAVDAPEGEVNEVRIASSSGATEISIFTQGSVQVRDFLLSDPARLIVDIEGARHALTRHAYEGIGRGGVVRLRSSQFRDGVVRLVFDLSRRVEYRVTQDGDRIRIQFPNPGSSFSAWSSGGEQGAGRLASRPAGGSSTDGRSASSTGNAGGRSAPSARSAAALQQSGQPRISVSYDSANMLDVIAGFSEFSGRSIVPGEGVGQKIVRGVDIQNQPWDVALDAILQSQGLGWRRTESGIILVDDLQDIRGRDTLQTETRVFRINYTGADTVANALEQLASAGGQVVPYQATNSVIVSDAPSVVGRMDSLVNVLDRRTPQVSIEAKIVFVQRDDVQQLGVQYDLKDTGGFTSPPGGAGNQLPGAFPNAPTTNPDGPAGPTVLFGGESVAATGNANSPLPSGALEILAATAFGDFSLFTFLSALEEHRLSDVQAMPSIQVVDNHTARIQVGEKTPIRVLEPQAQVQQAQVNVQFEDTGIILEVTPHITNNNQILLDLMAERSSVQSSEAVEFFFRKQLGETRLLLNDGETAVIGGLTQSEVSRIETGIPGLMNLPLIGGLFKRSDETETKQDLIILVTPHIVTPGYSGGDQSNQPSSAASTASMLSG